MKYNEAIDMILDGGECYQRKDLGYRFRFDPEGDWLQSKYSGVNGSLSWQSYTEDIIITKGMTKETDWIAEKDGVVYEEAPKQKFGVFSRHIEKCLERIGDKWIADLNSHISNISTIFIKDRTHNQDEAAKLEEGGEPWERIKMPSEMELKLLDNLQHSALTLCLDCHRNGTNFPGNSVCGNCDSSNTRLHFDIDTIESTFKDLNSQLKIMTRALTEANKLGDAYLYHLSHECKNSRGIDEEWLEKKMLCLLQKTILSAEASNYESATIQDILRIRHDYLENMDCGHDDCPFCFPGLKAVGKTRPYFSKKEQPKTDHIPDMMRMLPTDPYLAEAVKHMIENDAHNQEPRKPAVCPDILGAYGEQPREKVTVEWILEKINYLASCNYTRGKYEFERILISEAKEEQFNELKQKIEYLVSLQEK